MKKNIVLIGIITLIWGYTWVTMKIGLTYVPPFLFSSLRMLIGAVPLFIIQWILKKPWIPAKEDWKNIGMMSLFMSIGYFGLLTYGMQFVSSGQTSVMVYTMPIFVTILAHFVLKEKLTILKAFGLCTGVIGLLFILGPQVFHFHLDKQFIGEILILLAAISWGCANIFSKIKFSNYDIIKMTSWQLLIGAFSLFCISVVVEPISQAQWTPSSLGILLFNGLFSTAFTFVAWFWVLTKIEASIASMTLMIVPLLGLFFGWLQLGEKLTSNIIFGAIFICFGIFFAAFRVHKKVELFSSMK